MMDQCKRFSEKGVVAKFVGEAMTDKNVIKEVLEGRVQLLYITPESISYPESSLPKYASISSL